jgi:hypothetical protein
VDLPFTLKNTGAAAETDRALHPMDARPHLDADVYRLPATVAGRGWTVELPNALAAVDVGSAKSLVAAVAAGAGSARTATVTLRAVSESDPTKSATASVTVTR